MIGFRHSNLCTATRSSRQRMICPRNKDTFQHEYRGSIVNNYKKNLLVFNMTCVAIVSLVFIVGLVMISLVKRD